MSNVRLRFGGIIGFLTRMLSLVTGIIFTILITRNLSVTEFGQWNVIGSLLVYGVFFSTLLGYWYTRYTARNINIVRGGVLFSVIFSFIGIISYLITSYLFVSEFKLLYPIILIGAIQIPTSSLIEVLSKIAEGKKPEYSSYGSLAFESAKTTIALLMILITGISLMEAIQIIIIAQILHILVLTLLLRNEFKFKTDFKKIKESIRSLWIPAYTKLSGLIYMSDALLVDAITFSYTNIAIFKVAIIFSTIIEYGNQLTYPLYIKLLGGGKLQDVLISTKLLFMFTIPLSIGIFILAKPMLFLLNPEYVISEKILQVLVLYNFSLTVNSLFSTIIMGVEKVDTREKIKVVDLIHSALFKIPTLQILRVSGYIAMLIVFLFFAMYAELSAEMIGIIWAIILVGSNIPITIYMMKLAKERISFKFPWSNIGKYFISSTIMGFILFYFMQNLTYNPKTLEFAPEIFILIGFGALVYFGILFCIDMESRYLLKKSLSFAKK